MNSIPFRRAHLACAAGAAVLASSLAPLAGAAAPAKEIAVQVGQLQTQRIVWKPRSAGTAAQPPFQSRGPGCPAVTESVANCFNNIDTGGEATIQAGMAVGEAFGSTYTVANPSLSFPIEVTQVEFFAGTVASGIGGNVTMGWRVEVWDGEPGQAGSSVAFSVDSDPDPSGTGQPGDITLQRVSGQGCSDCSILTGGGTPASGSLAKVQFSVDQTADPADRMLVYNTSGTGKFTVMVYMLRANDTGGSTCGGLYTPPCGEVLPCSNAYLVTEGSTVTPCSSGTSNGTSPTYGSRNWASYVTCADSGCPAGFSRFSSLSSSCHPTRDVLQQVTYSVSACAGVPSGACCSPSGICSTGTQAACAGTSAYQGDNTTCAAGSCPTGACCTVNGVCTPTTQPGCAAANTFQGAGTVCGPNPCPQPSGACCISGACSTSTQTTCSGSFQGAGTTCDSITCPQPTGACCFGTGCLTAAANDCASASGVFQNGVACSGSACPTGACCVVNTGACSTATPAACTSGGGTYRGTGVACSTTSCPPPTGACCSSNGFCLPSQTQADCTNAGLTWSGGGTVCSPNPCSAPTGTCCRGSLCSMGVAQGNCTAPSAIIGAAYVSSTSTCNASGNGHAPCCYADFNKVNGIGVQDIFDYLNSWFAKSPYCKVAGDGTTAPGVQDIFDYLNTWFAGGC